VILSRGLHALEEQREGRNFNDLKQRGRSINKTDGTERGGTQKRECEGPVSTPPESEDRKGRGEVKTLTGEERNNYVRQEKMKKGGGNDSRLKRAQDLHARYQNRETERKKPFRPPYGRRKVCTRR